VESAPVGAVLEYGEGVGNALVIVTGKRKTFGEFSRELRVTLLASYLTAK
jgi:hypothetical protein